MILEGTLRPPSYDFIYVDEAQFFAPVWFRIIRACQEQKAGRLFLAADPTQGFLKRRQSWSQCGLDVRGRSVRLRKSYRNTQQILRFALDFYLQRLPSDEQSELNLPGPEELNTAPVGEKPLVLRLTARQDEVSRVAQEISACLQSGLPPADILVIVAGENRTKASFEALARVPGPGRLEDARSSPGSEKVRLCGINGATGLEAPVVFMIGAADLIDAEADCQLDEDARAELIRDNTRRLYMAFTRAIYKLVITWTAEILPPWLLNAQAASEGQDHGSTREPPPDRQLGRGAAE